MAHDPDVLRGLVDRIESAVDRWREHAHFTVRLSNEEWRQILAVLRAPQGDGAEAMREALESLVESLRPAEHVPFVDPVHGAAVEALGRRIGFGALMSSASASWAKVAAERGDPAGGEFVSGPCRAVLQSDLRRARAALDQHSLTKNGGADHDR